MSSLKDDPRLTAYALGELEPAERARFEDELRADPEALREVEEIRKLASDLTSELKAEPSPGLGGERRKEIERRAVSVGVAKPIKKAVRWRLRILGGLATAAALVLAFGTLSRPVVDQLDQHTGLGLYEMVYGPKPLPPPSGVDLNSDNSANGWATTSQTTASSLQLAAGDDATFAVAAVGRSDLDARLRKDGIAPDLRDMTTLPEFHNAPKGPWDWTRQRVRETDPAFSQHLATTNELRTRAPALLARPDGPELKELPLESLRLSTVLMATRARVLVDMTFSNPHPRQLEGTLMVRLPDGASPCALGMFQGDGKAIDAANVLPPALESPLPLLQEKIALASSWSSSGATVEWGELRPAHVVEEKKAKQVYEQTTRRRVDPALMEWSGGNQFSTRIFPIAPSGKKRVFFVYDVPPRELDGKATVALPVPEKLPPACRVEVAVSKKAYESARILTAKGEEACSKESGEFFQSEISPEKDAKGSFLLAASPRSARVRAGFDLRDGGVHVRLSPEASLQEGKPTGEAVFVLDTSLSQKGKLAASCGKLLRAILERDSSIERFRVVTFDVTARPLFAGTRANTPGERERTLREVESLWLEGATNLEAALSLLEKTTTDEESARASFFLLSDAQVTWGVEEARELERAFPRIFRARWIAYQLGDAPVNRPLCEKLARNGGRVVSVVSAQDLDAAAVAHRTRPTVLEHVRVEGAKARDLLVAGAPRAIFPGETLEVGFRVDKGADLSKAQVVVETEAGPQSFDLSGIGEDALAGRAWAELSAARLLELQDEDADKVAVALSQRYALANRVASLLILETDAEYVQHKLGEEDLDLAKLSELAKARDARRPIGGPDLSALDEKARAFLFANEIVSARGSAWPQPPVRGNRREAPPRPEHGERLDPVKVHEDASLRFAAGKGEDALRELSSIVEESPRDARALRLVGFTLLSWGRFEDAAGLFARARTLRPFEPQAHLCEAFALAAQGKIGEAALRYELVLAGEFDPRYSNYAKEGAKRLYGRLLPGLGKLGLERAATLGISPLTDPAKHEAWLFWNLDDTDVDLHTRESDGTEVNYQHTASPSGGRLHWDNTAGLGPEVYTHPSKEPAELYVNYFGTSSVSGTVPSATLVVYWKGGRPLVRSAVLATQKSKVVLYEAGED